MSQDHLIQALERANKDGGFAQLVSLNPNAAAETAGFALDDSELESLSRLIPQPDALAEELRFQQQKAREQLSAQVARVNQLGAYTVRVLKDTLNNARGTYQLISSMTRAMFIIGLTLFVAGAVTSMIAEEVKYALVFGGFGAVTFAALFFTGPIDKSQNALSNLVQVEILFMNYFEQITFWENYALMPEGNPPAPQKSNIDKASSSLQERTKQTAELLQRLVEAK